MTRTRILLSAMLVCFLAVTACTQQKGNIQEESSIQGVWRMLSQKVDGEEMLTASASQLKFITAKNWVFIAQDKDKTIAALERKSQDPLKDYMDAFGAGAGIYELSGNTYTETVEKFPDPAYIGRSFSFTVKVEGNRFYQSGSFPVFENGEKIQDSLLEEVYERVE